MDRRGENKAYGVEVEMRDAGRTVDEPDTGVVSDDAERDRSTTRDMNSVTSHWVRLAFNEGRIQLRIVRGVVFGTVDDLHGVSV